MSALRNVHLAPEEEEDDLYSGYNDPDLDVSTGVFTSSVSPGTLNLRVCRNWETTPSFRGS